MDAKRGASTGSPGFLLTTCQVGAEAALKSEVARDWPAFRFAYSRPGFVTFKLPSNARIDENFRLGSVFARRWGFSLGKVTGADVDERARGVWQLAADVPCDALHVWQRDLSRPGRRGFEPHVTPAALQAERAIRNQGPPAADVSQAEHPRIARPGDRVLDCVLVEAEQWWVGWHQARAIETRYPGGMIDLSVPQEAVSRAYRKMAEALAWSELPIAAGDRLAELGCAPGGASQALLDRGAVVTGIDPATVEEQLLAHPNFTHVRKRAADVRRREFRGIDWLTADMNVAPATALDDVEAIVTHAGVNVRGLLLTLKLLDWSMADDIPRHLDRVRSWGYDEVKARQLVWNRQEYCLMALRPARRKRTSRKPSWSTRAGLR